MSEIPADNKGNGKCLGLKRILHVALKKTQNKSNDLPSQTFERI